MEQHSLRGLNLVFNNWDLTATGSETVYDAGGGSENLDFCIDGKWYVKADVVDGVTPTTDGNGDALATLTADTGCVIVWCINAAGTVGVFQGDVETLDPDTDLFANPDAPQFPAIPDAWVPFAYQVLKADGTAGTITFGSSDWDATGFTNVIEDVAVLPSRPQIS